MKSKMSMEPGRRTEDEQDSSGNQSVQVHGCTCAGVTKSRSLLGCNSGRIGLRSGVYPPPWERFGSGTGTSTSVLFETPYHLEDRKLPESAHQRAKLYVPGWLICRFSAISHGNEMLTGRQVDRLGCTSSFWDALTSWTASARARACR